VIHPLAVDYHEYAEEVVTMLRRNTRVLLLGWAAIWLVLPIAGQESDTGKERQMEIPSAGGRTPVRAANFGPG
jgi:hypothetical protein